MDGSNRTIDGNMNTCLSNYKLGKSLCFWSYGIVKFAEHILTGDKVTIYIINCRWTKDKIMEEKGSYHLHKFK